MALSGSLTRQKFDAIHQEVYRFATVEAFDQEDQTDSEFLLICFVEVDLTCSQGEITNNKTLFMMCSCSKCFSLFLELTISVLTLQSYNLRFSKQIRVRKCRSCMTKLEFYAAWS